MRVRPLQTPNRPSCRHTGKMNEMKYLLATSALALVASGSFAQADMSVASQANRYDKTDHLTFDSGFPVGPVDTSPVVSAAYDPVEEMTLSFIFHIDDGMAEQDVFYEKVPGSGEIYRPTAATRKHGCPAVRARRGSAAQLPRYVRHRPLSQGPPAGADPGGVVRGGRPRHLCPARTAPGRWIWSSPT